MTPLMQAVQKNIKKGKFRDEADLLPLLKEQVGYFEISGIFDAANTLARDVDQMRAAEHQDKLNLPFDHVWMENARIATVFGDTLNDPEIYVTDTRAFILTDKYSNSLGKRNVGDGELLNDNVREKLFSERVKLGHDLKNLEEAYTHIKHTITCLGALFMLNTPNMTNVEREKVSRVNRSRFAGKKTELVNSHNVVKLLIDGKPVDCSTCVPCEETGKMPYHIVRGHMHRYWIGGELKPKWVDPYWKGNPDVGTTTKTYEVSQG